MDRFIENEIKLWLKESNKALLVSGARQVGKTYTIRKVLNELQLSYFEINFIENPDILKVFKETSDTKALITRLRLYSPLPLKEKESIIFLDEIQEYPDIITKIKFLVDDGSFKYILSGSLLGVEIKNIRSIPVGYYTELRMYPMSFLEFLKAYGITNDVIENINTCYLNEDTIDPIIHQKMLELFYYYLIVGGMPDVVKTFLETKNLVSIDNKAKDIINQYKADFSKYEHNDKKLRIISIYDNITSQLNKQNQRFVFSYLNKELKFERYENSFLWLKDAGVAYPCYIANEIKMPLAISKEKNMFKLFMNDVGLLVSTLPFSFRTNILSNNTTNNGGLFENFVMQELVFNGFIPYYYKSKKIGEIDFLIEKDDGIYALEVKSGKDFKSHKALDSLIKEKEYQVSKYIVLSKSNLFKEGSITYLPIYMCEFIKDLIPSKFILPDIKF